MLENEGAVTSDGSNLAGTANVETRTDSQNVFVSNRLYGTFFLGEGEFALDVETLQEVVPAPERYIPVPLSPPFLLGLYNLRGKMVPVISLYSLLDMPSTRHPEDGMIAIVNVGGVLSGLLFDETAEVIRIGENNRAKFSFHQSAESIQVIRSAFKLDNGNRIIQEIDVRKLFSLGGIPHDDGQRAQESERYERSQKGPRHQAISFTVGKSKCALRIDSIQEIRMARDIQPTNYVGDHCFGRLVLRGASIPLIDTKALLGRETDEETEVFESEEDRIIVMRCGEGRYGLHVSCVHSIVNYYQEELLSFPAVGADESYFLGCIVSGDEETIMINHDYLASLPSVARLVGSHSRLYDYEEGVEKGQEQLVHYSYITFTLGGLFGISIDEIREILEKKENLLSPPGLPDYVHGLLNLRGDIVPIVDIHKFCGGNAEKQPLNYTKILIFEQNSRKVGVLVEDVNQILHFTNQGSIELPEMIYKRKHPSLVDFIAKGYTVQSLPDGDLTFLALNPLEFHRRVLRDETSGNLDPYSDESGVNFTSEPT